MDYRDLPPYDPGGECPLSRPTRELMDRLRDHLKDRDGQPPCEDEIIRRGLQIQLRTLGLPTGTAPKTSRLTLT